MKRRKKRYYDSYELVKSHQQVTRYRSEEVHSWEVDDCYINNRAHLLNKRRRSRVGHIETRKPR